MIKYYADASGNYVGAFAGTSPPLGSTEINVPPSNALATWNGSVWSETVISPTQVSMAQARLALHANGQLTTVQAALDGLGDISALIEWNHASSVFRDNALTASMAAVLSLDSAALDALFIQAAAI